MHCVCLVPWVQMILYVRIKEWEHNTFVLQVKKLYIYLHLGKLPIY